MGVKKRKRGPKKQKENKPGKPRKRKKLVSVMHACLYSEAWRPVPETYDFSGPDCHGDPDVRET